MPRPEPFPLRVHKASQQAYILLDGRRLYLGRHDAPETRQRYHALVAGLLANGGRPPAPAPDITIIELADRYLEHAGVYYGGPKSASMYRIIGALRPLLTLYPELPAASFGPLKLRTVRQVWIDDELSITTINGYVHEIRAMFKWGASCELVSAQIHQALCTLAGLRRGRGVGKDPQERDVVPLGDVEAVLPRLSRQLEAVARLQLLTGARPSELLNLTRGDLDMAGPVWVAIVRKHKTAHLGRERRLFFGPRAQAILKPFLLRAVDAYLFSPREAEAERYAKLNQEADSPRRPDQKANPRKTERTVGEKYDATDYARAVRRACDETGTARWTPYRLRHTAATNAEAAADIDVARAMLGHSQLDTTQIYLHKDFAAAAAYALTHG